MWRGCRAAPGEGASDVTTTAERRVEYMALSAILPATRNPKRHDAEGIRASLARFGVADLPVLDERTGRLVSGHGRLDQFAYLAQLPPTALADYVGRPGLPSGVRADPASGEWLVPVVRGWASASDAEADAYVIAANKLAVNGDWDDTELARMLADLVGADPDLAGLAGFDPRELDDIMARLEQVPVIVHDEVPATGARYAETLEQEAARGANIAAYRPAVDTSAGFTELILVYPVPDRDELARHVAAAREVLGADLRAAEVVLRAVRVLVAVLDARNGGSVDWADLVRHAGWQADP